MKWNLYEFLAVSMIIMILLAYLKWMVADTTDTSVGIGNRFGVKCK